MSIYVPVRSKESSFVIENGGTEIYKFRSLDPFEFIADIILHLRFHTAQR